MTRTEAGSAIRSLMPLYEQNYRLMTTLVPALRSISRPVSLILNDDPRCSLSVIECTRYTSLLAMEHGFGAHGIRLLRDVRMQLRVYHDARLLEVLSYQNRSRLVPFYTYPNPQMLSPLEKRQVNLFFGEWLLWCVKGGRCFEYDPGGLHVAFC